MNYKPLVSIITSCFNDGEYLMECIQSVQKQSYCNIEHIIVNDGSDDIETLKILNDIEGFKKVKVIHTSNMGVCSARNTAIKESKGIYILPLDSDDLISSLLVELCVREIEADENVKLVATNYKLFGRINAEVILESYSIEKLMGHNLFVVSTLFRRADFFSCGGFKTSMKEGLEDWDLWLSIMKSGGLVKYISGFNFFYRIKPKKLSRNIALAVNNHKKLRRLLWENHKEMFSENFPDPYESMEYLQVVKSPEYRLGKLLLQPIRKLRNLI